MDIKKLNCACFALGSDVQGYNKGCKKRALLYMIGPLVVFFVLYFLYQIVYWIFAATYGNALSWLPFVMTAMAQTATSATSTTAVVLPLGVKILSIAQVLVYDLIVLSVVMWFFSFPAGLILWFKKPLTKIDPASGLGKAGRLPANIKGWNWGAAGWPIVWGLVNFSWISLIGMIPVVNLVWWIYLGKQGNKLAWQKNKWESSEHFIAQQAKWKIAGIIGLLLRLGGVVYLIGQIVPNLLNR
ncbi:MAG: hypothetical protein WCO55_01745 [Candidatus Falkowbacteria bacterium]